MTNINISDLKPAGSEFFLNSENYLNELADSELNSIYGGIKLPIPPCPIPRPPRPPFLIPRPPWV